MAIATSVDTSYFVLDTPDVRWTSAAAGRKVTVTITPANGTPVSFTESYTPDADNAVTLRGLAALLQPYVKPCPTPLCQDLLTTSGVWLATVTRAAWSAQLYDGSTPATAIGAAFQSYAYYASQRTNTRPGSAAFWLTRYTDRIITPEQPMVAAFFLTADTLAARLRVFHLDAEGAIQTRTVAVTVGQNAVYAAPPSYAAVLHYTLAAVATAAEVTADSIRIVDFQLLRSGNVIDSVRFRIDRQHRPQLRIVAFTNCFGMLETEALTGSDERTTEMAAEFAWMDDDYEKTTQQEVTTERLCAGHVTEVQRNSLRDLAASPEVCLIHENGEGCFEHMTVTAIEMTDRRPRTQPQTAYVTLRRSARHQEVVSRTGDTGDNRDRIFDYTFDETFN